MVDDIESIDYPNTCTEHVGHTSYYCDPEDHELLDSELDRLLEDKRYIESLSLIHNVSNKNVNTKGYVSPVLHRTQHK